MAPTISIVIPVFNEGKHLLGLVDSIKGTDNVIEILLVDDRSTEEYSALYDTIEGVTVIHKAVNEGKDKAILTGFERSRGDYIMILDGDLIGLSRSQLNELQKQIPQNHIINMIRGDDIPIAKFFGNTYITVGEHLVSRKVIERYKPLLFKDEEWSFDNELNRIIIGDPAIKAKFCEMVGVSHIMKEEKYGFWRGLSLDLKMMFKVIFFKYKVFGFFLAYLNLRNYIRDREKITAL